MGHGGSALFRNQLDKREFLIGVGGVIRVSVQAENKRHDGGGDTDLTFPALAFHLGLGSCQVCFLWSVVDVFIPACEKLASPS